jgi:hypothetical protein
LIRTHWSCPSEEEANVGRDGYVLLGVLWLTTGITGVGVLLAAAAHQGVSSARNRTALIEAGWTAEACLARAFGASQAALHAAARDPHIDGSAVWNRLEEAVGASSVPLPEGCRLSMRAVGSRLDLNSVEPTVIAWVLRNSEVPTERADSVAALIVEQRSLRPFRHPGELDRLLAAPEGEVLQKLVDVEPGPLSVNHLAEPILTTLPGLTAETAGRVVLHRSRGEVLTTFLEMGDQVSHSSREALVRAIPRLANVVTFAPPAWVFEADVEAGAPAVRVRTELHLARTGARVVVARRRTWIP